MQVRIHKIFLAGIASSCLLLMGCETTNPYSGQSEISDSAKGAGIGALGGAVLGVVTGGGNGAMIGSAIGAVGGGLIGHNMDRQNAELRQRLMGTGVQVNQVGAQTQLVMGSDITFNTNQASINANFYDTLAAVALVVKKYQNTNLMISGYTDDEGSSSYNQILSEKRAASVGSFLITHGVAAHRVFTQGFGKRYPVIANRDALTRAQNRRVVITLRPR